MAGMGFVKHRWIEAMQPTPQEWDRRWIPVSERLPEDRVRVLTCGDDPVEGPFTLIGFWEPASKFGPAGWWLPCFSEFGPVAYWMPLPEPPTG
jgi:hypothetical protein